MGDIVLQGVNLSLKLSIALSNPNVQSRKISLASAQLLSYPLLDRDTR